MCWIMSDSSEKPLLQVLVNVGKLFHAELRLSLSPGKESTALTSTLLKCTRARTIQVSTDYLSSRKENIAF